METNLSLRKQAQASPMNALVQRARSTLAVFRSPAELNRMSDQVVLREFEDFQHVRGLTYARLQA